MDPNVRRLLPYFVDCMALALMLAERLSLLSSTPHYTHHNAAAPAQSRLRFVFEQGAKQDICRVQPEVVEVCTQ